jgi:DNA (cytosine-5)-methyltransferase 1
MFTFYEFFAGGGMARAGLGPNWQCLFANDFDAKKGATYQSNWGEKELLVGDIKKIKADDLPEYAQAVWGSFPCQDLSLAGGGAGLKGERSGTFWPFWDLMKSLMKQGRAPEVIALENVCGAITSHNGKDFLAICKAFSDSGYKVGAFVLDAAFFIPHSRPRLFFIGYKSKRALPQYLISSEPISPFHSVALCNAFNKMPADVKANWVWWKQPKPVNRKAELETLIENNPADVKWHSPTETKQLLSMMSDINQQKVADVQASGMRMVGTIYKRTRKNDSGNKVQRAEVRFDGLAGCLRTPAGGSSRQLILVVDNNSVRSRLISARETARLMGLPDTYRIPDNYNEAYHLTGDGVVAPVVRFIAENLLEPLLIDGVTITREAA